MYTEMAGFHLIMESGIYLDGEEPAVDFMGGDDDIDADLGDDDGGD
jgi:hypothetical protein